MIPPSTRSQANGRRGGFLKQMNRNNQIAGIVSTDWQIAESSLRTLDSYSIGEIVAELGASGRAAEDYRKRLDVQGMSNHGVVLDFGCGFGQWAVVLAESNQYVVGVDPSHVRLSFARELAKTREVRNVEFMRRIEDSRALDDGKVDLIVCNSVLCT